MGSRAGTLKTAAARTGLTPAEYAERIAAGLKWCTACKRWRARGDFGRDRSRSDGLAATCGPCRTPPNSQAPNRAERRERRAQGSAWCARCRDWRPLAEIHAGLCRRHRAEYQRERYRSDPHYQLRRKSKTYLRRRGVEAVPPIGQEVLLEEFAGRCAYCGSPAETWDHIVPVSQGGRTTPGNVVPACRSCNSSKKDQDVIEWLGRRGLDPHPQLYERMTLAWAGLYG